MIDSAGPPVPPQVPFALTLGVTGHRAAAIPGEAVARLTERIASVIAALEEVARTLAAREAGHFADCAPSFTIVSPLADGADQIAAEVALEREMRIVAFTGKDGGALAKMLTDADIHINVPHARTARIQEVHLCAIHCIGDGIDVALFGGEEE